MVFEQFREQFSAFAFDLSRENAEQHPIEPSSPAFEVDSFDTALGAVLHDFEQDFSLVRNTGDAGIENFQGKPLRLADAGDSKPDEQAACGGVQRIELFFSDERKENEVFEKLG
mgnify:CR=1 FL=1